VNDPLFDKIGNSRFWAARKARRSERQRGRGTCLEHVPSNPSLSAKYKSSPNSFNHLAQDLANREQGGLKPTPADAENAIG
jgi:hypothetical protein